MKIAVYPFCRELFSFVKWYRHFDTENQIVYALSPSGTALADHDIAYSVNCNVEVGIKTLSEYHSSLCEVESVWVFDDYVIDQEDYEKLRYEAGDSNLPIKHIGRKTENDFAGPYEKQLSHTAEIMSKYRIAGKYIPHAPVVMIGGFSVECGFAETTAILASTLKQKGIRVAALTPTFFSGADGFYTYPKEFWMEDTHEKRVMSLNRLIYSIEESYEPQIFLIQMPESLMAFDNKILNDFGYEAQKVLQAVSADYFVYCSDYRQYSPEMIRRYVSDISKMNRISVKAFMVSNLLFRYHDTQMRMKNEFLYLSSKYLESITPSCSDALLIDRMDWNNDGEKLVDHLIAALT